MRLTFVGSILFLIGYLLFGIFVPPEFSLAGEIHDHVRRMRDLADAAFVRSRLDVSEKLVERMGQWRAFKPPQPLMISLTQKVKELASKISGNADVSADEAAGLFHADLSLRKHDAPVLRLTTALVMVLGIVCLAYSTGSNVLKALIYGFV
jgi:hypothetical protein